MTFEHIPPKKAFNDHQQLLRTLEDHISGRPGGYLRFRKGLGKYSLCERCNNNTGSWYGPAFVDWTRQGFEWFNKVEGEKILSLPYYVQPLNVLKQVMVMAVAMSNEVSLDAHKEIRRFLLRPGQRYMPSDYRAFVYFNMRGQLRFTSGMAILDTEGKGSDYVMAEVALPPFGYCVTRPVGHRQSLAASKGLYEITQFSRYGLDEWAIVHLRIPTRETNFPSPLDYRNREGVEAA